MYTQCSKCETIFRLSAEVLRAAGGQVRCGRCSEVFNALARLAEEPTDFSRGESSFDLETRADNILESAATYPNVELLTDEEPQTALADGVEVARLEVLPEDDAPELPPLPTVPPDLSAAVEAELADDSSLEFTLPPGELDRIFVESKAKSLQNLAADASSLSLKTLAAELHDEQATEPTEEQPGVSYAMPEPEAQRARITGLEVPEHVRRDMLAEFAGAQEAQDAQLLLPAVPRRPFALWLSAAVLLALLLAGQWAHANRTRLAANGAIGPGIRAVYSALGSALPAPANLSAYQLRQWGVTGDPGANGTLRVRASILNIAAQFQPYPLLRVTLANRFGGRIGAREFGPTEYLGKPVARLLAPGERVDATLDILDPGNNAEGFEIDVCLRGTDQRIACADDAAAQVKQ